MTYNEKEPGATLRRRKIMNSVSRWIVLSAGVLVGLSGAAGTASACHRCKSVTYYQPVTNCCAPPTTCCAPPAPSAVVPVTVTTTRCGLFGLRTRTTVSYGAPVAASGYAPPPPPVFTPPVPNLAPPPPVPVPATSAYPPAYPSSRRVLISYP